MKKSWDPSKKEAELNMNPLNTYEKPKLALYA